jgi:hypothetical protein
MNIVAPDAPVPAEAPTKATRDVSKRTLKLSALSFPWAAKVIGIVVGVPGVRAALAMLRSRFVEGPSGGGATSFVGPPMAVYKSKPEL